MMELEARILDEEGVEVEAYFYATDDVEYVIAESIARARLEIDNFATIEVVPFNDEYRVLAEYHAWDDTLSYF